MKTCNAVNHAIYVVNVALAQAITEMKLIKDVFKLALSSEREEARTPNIEEEKSAISTETNSSNILPETTPKVSTDEKCIDKAN